jgi:hypothetical protein
MLKTTSDALKAVLRADPSLNVADRNRLLALLRGCQRQTPVETSAERTERIVRRAEAARRLSCSLRTVDKLAASGVLAKRKLPGRVRATGFLESDLVALLVG